jgi:hypothetical protein
MSRGFKSHPHKRYAFAIHRCTPGKNAPKTLHWVVGYHFCVLTFPRTLAFPHMQGAKKGKPPPKDDKKKKPERQVQGKVPEPLDEATAAMLAPIQFRMAREAVVSAINDLETLLPLCD